jgi:hypothetical protein
MLVQDNWLYRFQRQPLPRPIEFTDFPDIADIIAHWHPIADATDNYIQGLTDQSWSEVITKSIHVAKIAAISAGK